LGQFAVIDGFDRRLRHFGFAEALMERLSSN
jgi:hypothetical protein